MDFSTLESWLWQAACSVRGELSAHEYKDYILPLVFYKRLDDVYSDEITAIGIPADLIKADRKLSRFYIPEEARWDSLRRTTTGLGERVTDALRLIGRENKNLEGIIDRRDFNATD